MDTREIRVSPNSLDQIVVASLYLVVVTLGIVRHMGAGEGKSGMLRKKITRYSEIPDFMAVYRLIQICHFLINN